MSVAAENRRLSTRLAIVAAGMFGFAFALVPFYNEICAALGVQSLVEKSEPLNSQIDRSRTVTIELDSNAHNMAWRFRPLVNHVEVHPGQLMTVEYEVVNVRNVPVTGQAVPSYGPQIAGSYFRKLDCFCFQQQTLAPGERRVMPVTFVVDPKLPKDLNAIAVSYTFFEVDGKRAAAPGGRS
ncbi:MAG TPA: cytochrome c oxidase assembly protein [Burkholderiales bacterium]|nr:cytochrome c oxidase assembly protein [Burkholderiales bacterium]